LYLGYLMSFFRQPGPRVLGSISAGLLASVRCEETRKPSSSIVTPSSRHLADVKIWGTGLLKDPVGLSEQDRKRGKGVQHLNSEYWIEGLGVFIAFNLPRLRSHLLHTEHATQLYEYRYYLNQSNVLFMRALRMGLASKEAQDLWLWASWCAMVAAEVDGYNYAKYTPDERRAMRKRFYDMYLREDACAANDAPPIPVDDHAVPHARIDLIPPVALERLSLHNELCCLLWKGSVHSWQVDGFPVSKRIDSLKRHMDEAHHMEYEEDAIGHLIWNFMAVFHVITVFPHLNDCPNYEAVQHPSKG